MNESKKFLTEKVRKILTFIITCSIFITALIGSIFGFINSAQNKGPTTQNNNQKVVLQTSLGNTDLKTGVNFIKKTIDFAGLKDAQVRSFGQNSIQVTTPVNSFVDDKNTQKGTYENVYKLSNNQNYAKELEGIIISLFYTGTIEFRTAGGTPIFTYDKSSTKVSYNKDGIAKEKSGKATEKIELQDPIPMFSTASVNHYNGTAYLNIDFKNRSKSLIDSYKNAFKE